MDMRKSNEAAKKCTDILENLYKTKPSWPNEKLTYLAYTRAIEFIFAHIDIANLFRIYPTNYGGVLIEFDKNEWCFDVEIFSDGKMQIEGSSEGGKTYDANCFNIL